MRKSGFQKTQVHRNVEKAHTMGKNVLVRRLLKILYDSKNLLRGTDKYVHNLKQKKMNKGKKSSNLVLIEL